MSLPEPGGAPGGPTAAAPAASAPPAGTFARGVGPRTLRPGPRRRTRPAAYCSYSRARARGRSGCSRRKSALAPFARRAPRTARSRRAKRRRGRWREARAAGVTLSNTPTALRDPPECG
eukprot:1195230-Prorocentrum_minimum.AAC.2